MLSFVKKAGTETIAYKTPRFLLRVFTAGSSSLQERNGDQEPVGRVTCTSLGIVCLRLSKSKRKELWPILKLESLIIGLARLA
jgi:hypothetical protein